MSPQVSTPTIPQKPRYDQCALFFHTGTTGEYENLCCYTKHGMHPVTLGQILPLAQTCVDAPYRKPRYKIHVKLGFGEFSTVWLARDLVEERWVSVKVCRGTDSTERSREAKILSEIGDTMSGEVGHEHVVRLFDTFIIKGPNGFHECLVTEVVAPLTDGIVFNCLPPDAIRQVAQGFAFLHEHGIIHSDPHIGNFGVAIPQVDQIDEENMALEFSDPELVPLMPRSRDFTFERAPCYIAPRESIARYLQQKKLFPGDKPPIVKILDFGRAHSAADEAATLPGAVPIPMQSPESILHHISDGKVGSPWSKAADVWAVGGIMFHLLVCDDLFEGRGWRDPTDYMLATLELGGPPLAAWTDFVEAQRVRYPERVQLDRDGAWQDLVAFRIRGDATRRELLIDLLKRMLVTDPEARVSMSEALAHPLCRRANDSAPPQ